MGWATVAAYVVATLLAVLTIFRQPGRQRIFWFCLAALLLLLAINKQLDLQSALTAAGRCMAQAQGWYEQRQTVQLTFIIVIAAICLTLGLTLAWIMRKELAHIWVALIGLALLLAFVAIRAAGFHHFDRFIGYEIGGLRMNWVLELGGIAIITINALWLLLSDRKTRHYPDKPGAPSRPTAPTVAAPQNMPHNARQAVWDCSAYAITIPPRSCAQGAARASVSRQ